MLKCWEKAMFLKKFTNGNDDIQRSELYIDFGQNMQRCFAEMCNYHLNIDIYCVYASLCCTILENLRAYQSDCKIFPTALVTPFSKQKVPAEIW